MIGFSAITVGSELMRESIEHVKIICRALSELSLVRIIEELLKN
jgi:hypothetical protein